MIHPPTSAEPDPPKPILPALVFDRALPDSLEDAAFSSGSALALLHGVLHDPILNVPSELQKERLALHAAQNWVYPNKGTKPTTGFCYV